MTTLVGSVIAPALQNRCRLIKLNGHTKAAMEPGWNLDANYSPEDAEIIAHVSSGSNYGIIPTNGLVVIDCDTEKLYDNLPKKWKESLTVITGRNDETGRHVFLYCNDSPSEKFIINDPETAAPLGDIRGSGSKFYTVGAGSIHPDSGKKYEYVDRDAPIIEVLWSEIKKALIDNYPIPFKKVIPRTTHSSIGSLSDKLRLRIEDFAMPDNPVQRANGDIQGSHPIHGSTTGMNFAINPQKNVWHCYRDNVGGDPVAWIAYAHCGVDEQNCNRLSTEEFKDVKTWLSDNGYAREIEELSNEYFSDKDLPEVDISSLLNPPILEDEEAELDRAIEEAKKRGRLPVFPDIQPGLLRDYIEFGKQVTYSLPEFHFAAALSVISMAIGRKVAIQVGMSRVYPNIFAMVIGHTTISGKSVACDMAVDTLSKVVLHEEELATYNSVRLQRGETSSPTLVQDLADVYNRLWYWDDCSPFLENATGWNANVLGTLCTIYDNRPVERSLSRTKDGHERIWKCQEPFMSLLFNTTNMDLEQLSTNRMFSSGFYPRMMWFIGEGGSPRKNHQMTSEESTLLQSVVSRVKHIKETLHPLKNDSIVFTVSEPIEEWRLSRTMNRLDKEDEAYRASLSRGFIHAYKLAVIFTITDPEFYNRVLLNDTTKYPISIEIPNRHAMEAIRIVENYLLPRTLYVYDLCNKADDKNHQVIILKALDHFGGVAERTKLLRRTHLASKDVTAAIRTLVESGEVKTCERRCDGALKPSTFVMKI
jgi:hypothetical protein